MPPLALVKSYMIASQFSPVKTINIVRKASKNVSKFILGEVPLIKSNSPFSLNLT